jgi:hypothetical protein
MDAPTPEAASGSGERGGAGACKWMDPPLAKGLSWSPSECDQLKKLCLVTQDGEYEEEVGDALDEDVDRIWDLLKTYSLITVRTAAEQKSGSMHRLLQAVLRSAHTRQQAEESLSVCVHALRHLWRFNHKDTHTWATAALYVEHVTAIGRQAGVVGVHQLEMAKLLTRAAGFMSIVTSR